VLLLRRLTGEGIHLLGASQYVTLLLTAEEPPQPRGCRPQDLSRKAGQRQEAGRS
jgi:hypothetical protein